MRSGALPCTGVVLAGGVSSRFGGVPKGLVEVGGRRVVDRVLDALRQVTDAQLLIGNDPAVADWLPGVPVAPDARPAGERGSLVGIHAALARAGTPVLVVAWDMPFVPAALLAELRRRGEAARAAVVPAGRTPGIEACCAYYLPEHLEVAARQLDRGELRLSAFVAALPRVVRLEGADLDALGDPATMFLNVNDADDLAAAERVAARLAVRAPG